MRAVLRLPTYRRLLAAYTLNELAWSIGSLTLALLVYRRTGSAVGAMGFFLAAQFVPALIAPAVVARLDQRPVRRVLPTLYALEAVAFLLLGWVASRFLVAPVLGLTIIDGVLALSARPLARATTVAVTAPVGLLREANAVTNASFSLCYFAGPAIAAGVVVAGGTMAALFANSALFALIATTMVTARGLPDGARRPSPVAGRLRAALALRPRAAARSGRMLGLQVDGACCSSRSRSRSRSCSRSARCTRAQAVMARCCRLGAAAPSSAASCTRAGVAFPRGR